MNVNLIFDLSNDFLDNVRIFIEAIRRKYSSEEAINMKLCKFLQPLENKDVVTSLYGHVYKQTNTHLGFDTKRVDVGSCFVDVITNNYPIKDFLPVLMYTYVMQGTDKCLINALDTIYQSIDFNDILFSFWFFEDDTLFDVLTNLCDYRKLYECCIKYSRIDLAIFIVTNLHKDMKSYQRFIAEISDPDGWLLDIADTSAV